MFHETLAELIKNQHFCYIETADYPFEGFITKMEDDFIEMYVFRARDENIIDLEEDNLSDISDSMTERVIFLISSISYIWPDHYLKLKPADLEAKVELKNAVLGQRKSKKRRSTKIETK